MRHFFNILFFSIILLSLFSCQDDESSSENSNLGACDVQLEDFALNIANRSLIYFENYTKIYFQNERGEELEFFFEGTEFRSEENNFVSADSLNYCFNVESTTSTLTASNGIELTIVSESKPYYPEIEGGYYADVLKVFYNDTNNTEIDRRLVFRKILDIKDYPAPLYETTTEIGEKVILGIEFEDVEFTEFNSPIIKLYFNDDDGILGFEDEQSMTWELRGKQ